LGHAADAGTFPFSLRKTFGEGEKGRKRKLAAEEKKKTRTVLGFFATHGHKQRFGLCAAFRKNIWRHLAAKNVHGREL